MIDYNTCERLVKLLQEGMTKGLLSVAYTKTGSLVKYKKKLILFDF